MPSSLGKPKVTNNAKRCLTRLRCPMVKRLAKEWLWLLGAVVTAIGVSLIYRDTFWRVGETGVALVSLYCLSVLIRTTMWAVSTVRKTVHP
jgi:hypothetical protein